MVFGVFYGLFITINNLFKNSRNILHSCMSATSVPDQLLQPEISVLVRKGSQLGHQADPALNK